MIIRATLRCLAADYSPGERLVCLDQQDTPWLKNPSLPGIAPCHPCISGTVPQPLQPTMARRLTSPAVLPTGGHRKRLDLPPLIRSWIREFGLSPSVMPMPRQQVSLLGGLQLSMCFWKKFLLEFHCSRTQFYSQHRPNVRHCQAIFW